MSRLAIRDIPYSLGFNGSTQYGKATSVPFANATKVTFLCWVRIIPGTQGMIWETSSNATSANACMLFQNYSNAQPGTLSFYVRDNTNTLVSQVRTAPVSSGWHRLCVTVDQTVASGQTAIYSDGALISISVLDQNCVAGIATNDLYVGMRAGSSLPFNGNAIVDHVITGKAFTAAEALSEYTTGRLPSGGTPLLTYAFNEGSGTTIADSSGNAKDITLTNSPTWTTASPMKARPVARVIPYSLAFNGGTQFGKVTAAPMANASKLTVTGWCKIATPVTQATILYETGSPNYTANSGFVMAQNGVASATTQTALSVAHFDTANNLNCIGTSPNLPTNVWLRFCHTIDESLVTNQGVLYLNGLIVPLTYTSNQQCISGLGTDDIYLGMRAGSTLPFTGGLIIDHVIKGKAFTAAEARSDYLTGVLPSGGTPLLTYAFSEGSGATVTDTSGSGKNITLTNSPTWTSDTPGHARSAVPVVQNLLSYSNDFTNVIWAKDVGGTGVTPVITLAAGIAPDGTNTAQRVQLATGASGFSRCQQVVTPARSATGDIGSVWMKTNDNTTKSVLLRQYITETVLVVTPTWQRFVVQVNSYVPTSDFQLMLWTGHGTDATADLLVWEAQKTAASNWSNGGPQCHTDALPVNGGNVRNTSSTRSAA